MVIANPTGLLATSPDRTKAFHLNGGGEKSFASSKP